MLLSKNFRVISDSLLCFGCLLVYPHFLSGFFFKKPFRLQIFKIFFQYSVFKVRKSLDIRFRSPFRFHPMGLSGLEPPTSRLSGVRSNRLSYKPRFTAPASACTLFSGMSVNLPIHNGDGEIRTLDPLLARQVLSQLSYAPLNPAATCSPMPSPA